MASAGALWHHLAAGGEVFVGSTGDNAAIIARVEAKPSTVLERLLEHLFRWLLTRVSVENEWVRELRELGRRGTVVHVLLRMSLLELLLVDQLCRLHGLAPIRLVVGAGRYASWPLRWMTGVLWRQCRTCDAASVTETVQAGESSILVLRQGGRKGGGRLVAESTEALIKLQRETARPIVLVPHDILWGRRRQGVGRGPLLSWWRQQLNEGPGLLRLAARIIGARNEAQIHLVKPLDLRELVDANRDESDEELAQRARFELRRRIEQDRKVVLGPMAKSAEAIRDEVLRNVALEDELRTMAEAQGVPLEKLQHRARKLLREIQAVPKSGYLAAFATFLFWVWNRIFEGVEIDREGLARWRETALEGPLVIVSSHKSHVDYLILSQLFWYEGIFPPHIAAGRNLSFWPLGPLFRGCGAFFIRRHFLDDAVYVAVLQAYITKILQEGYHLEFFIEGTRSRTGKMLPPKLGLLGMVADAASRLKGYKVHIAPVSVTYGRVPEEGAYAAEADGGEKRDEDIGGLLRARSALGGRHGVLYVQFGRPIDVAEHFRQQGAVDLGALSEPARRRVVANLAFRTVNEINRVTLVTPTALVATALLLNRRRGMTHSTLKADVDWIAESLGHFGARFSASLQDSEFLGVPEAVLGHAVRFLSDAKLVALHEIDGERIYTVSPERRLALDYYKNSTLHPLVNAMMVGAALGPASEEGLGVEVLHERARFLSRLLKHEFIFKADARFDVNVRRTLERLEELGHVELEGGRVRCPGHAARRAIETYGALLANFVESYRIMIRQVRRVGEGEVGEKELIKLARAQGERMYLVGEVDHREARSKINFQNAIDALRDLGVLERREGRRLGVAERFLKPDRLARLERRVASYLIHR
jgi:glycerol-3-phosphate O-acyltransferase